MDPAAHERLRRRIREIIAERHRDTHGGFLHLLPMAAAALPGIISAGKTLFGSGKYYDHKPEAKSRKPNAHAQLVKKIMADAKEHGARMSLADASRQAKAIREGGEKPRARKARAPRKAAAPRKPRGRKASTEKIVLE